MLGILGADYFEVSEIKTFLASAPPLCENVNYTNIIGKYYPFCDEMEQYSTQCKYYNNY